MNAEIIAVGTELLLGQIVNTNAQYISQGCAAMGVNVYYQTVVGDNESRLIDAFRLAKSRAELIICTGGLGPTQDDLTKDALAHFMNRKLLIDQASLDQITGFFHARSIPMAESNIRQAYLLEGSTPLANDTGMAVGLAISDGGTHYILLPGPPKEMKPMFDNYAQAWIKDQLTDEVPIYSKMLKFAGIGESSLEHKLIDLIRSQQDPTIAPYAQEGEVTIRLTTRAHTEAEGQSRVADTEAAIRELAGQYIYADENIAMEEAVIRMLTQQGTTLALAESCTGGLLSDLITSIPGSSKAFKGAIICYSNDVKNRLLSIPIEVLEGIAAPGAVSAEAAALLAEHVLRLLESDYSISITGVAGPERSEGKDVGTVYIAIAGNGTQTAIHTHQLTGNRELIKLKAAKYALYHLWKILV